MTLADQSQSYTDTDRGMGWRSEEGRDEAQQQQSQQEMNVGQNERTVSVAAGAILAAMGLARRSIPGMLIAGVGGALVYRGVTGRCPMYESIGLDTAHPKSADGAVEEEIDERGIHIEQAYLINKSAEELYQFWRNFENLPRIMTHLQSVKVLDERRSHWVATAPRIIGGKVEWDAEITSDEPNSRIAWRSMPGSEVDHIGEIRFSKAMGDRGTEVHVSMEYVPPAGKLGHWIATLFGESPRRKMRDDLRNFKRLMETGEIPTIIGQPHGTCTGEGEYYKE